MGLKTDCCMVISFFGILFYFSMGFIILGQPQFLKFVCNDSKKSIGACFIVCFIYILFFVGMILLKRRQASVQIERVNYVRFTGERVREESIAGIPMGEFKKYQEDSQDD